MGSVPSVGIVGCGAMGVEHARALLRLGTVRLAACCDTDGAKAAALAREAGTAYDTTDPLRVIRDPAVDAVYICTRNDTHADLAVAAAVAGKAMMVEKPLALSVAECRRIVDAVERGGVLCMTAFKFRFYPSVRRAAEFVPRPFIGIAQMLDRRWPEDFWGNDPVIGGGNVLSQGCHTVDLLCHLMGSEPVQVSAEGGTKHHASGSPVDTMVAVLRFRNGSLASLAQGDCGESPVLSKISLQIADGTRVAHLHDRLKTVALSDGQKAEVHTDDREMGVEEENRCFAEALCGGAAPPVSATDGLRATAVLTAAVDSLRTGKPQPVDF